MRSSQSWAGFLRKYNKDFLAILILPKCASEIFVWALWWLSRIICKQDVELKTLVCTWKGWLCDSVVSSVFDGGYTCIQRVISWACLQLGCRSDSPQNVRSETFVVHPAEHGWYRVQQPIDYIMSDKSGLSMYYLPQVECVWVRPAKCCPSMFPSVYRTWICWNASANWSIVGVFDEIGSLI